MTNSIAQKKKKMRNLVLVILSSSLFFNLASAETQPGQELAVVELEKEFFGSEAACANSLVADLDTMPVFSLAANPMDVMQTVMGFGMLMSLNPTEDPKFQQAIVDFENKMRNFGAQNFALLGQTNAFLKKKMSIINDAEQPEYDVDELSTNMGKLAAYVQERLTPEQRTLLGKLQGSVDQVITQFAAYVPGGDRIVTADRMFQSMTRAIETGSDNLEEGLKEIESIQKTLLEAKHLLALDDAGVANLIQQLEAQLLPQIKAMAEANPNDVGSQMKLAALQDALIVLKENRSKAQRGQIVAQQIHKIWYGVRENFRLGIARANDILHLTLPALEQTMAARIANAMAERMNQTSLAVETATDLALRALVKETGDTQAQLHLAVMERAKKRVETTEVLAAGIIAIERQQDAHRQAYLAHLTTENQSYEDLLRGLVTERQQTAPQPQRVGVTIEGQATVVPD